MFRDTLGNGGGGGDQRFNTTLMGRKAAIRFVNASAMEGRIYKHVYGRPISRDVRRALMWVVVHQAKHSRHPSAEKLNGMLQVANECSRPTARKHIRLAVDRGLISEETDGVNVFYFLTPVQIEKAAGLLNLLDIVPDVVRLQVMNPYDKRAGSDRVPAEVYYNVIDANDFPER